MRNAIKSSTKSNVHPFSTKSRLIKAQISTLFSVQNLTFVSFYTKQSRLAIKQGGFAVIIPRILLFSPQAFLGVSRAA